MLLEAALKTMVDEERNEIFHLIRYLQSKRGDS